ncbi:MAG: glutamate--tRNA ligase [Candidatus Saccharibacteria bacterium]
MSTPVRVRFAPSPTGFHHLGNIRSALFNWLYARHTGGTFVVRLEDTDRERLVQGADTYLKDTLNWLGLDWDEGIEKGGDFGPYIQSERLDLYREYADKLIASGALYPCWCTSERLDDLRTQAQKDGTAFKYDRHCLTNTQDIKDAHVLRFRIPDERGVISWNDEVMGEISYDVKELDDFVAVKSDGFPTYNFAVVIDDHLMDITHVLRGQEFLPTTPKNILVYEAYGWKIPAWVHLPAVLGSDKAKLSKRHGAKPSLEYREEGFLPEAIINFLAALGWNDGTTQEIFTPEELIKAFSLDRIQKSPAVFDAERLVWLNGYYIRHMPTQELLKRCEGFWPADAADQDTEYRLEVLELVQERLKFMSELPELTDFFFTEPDPSPLLLTKTMNAPIAAKHLNAVAKILEKGNWTLESLEAAMRAYCEKEDLKTGSLFGLLRVTITGRTAAPGLFETMLVLGEEAVIIRLRHAQKRLTV